MKFARLVPIFLSTTCIAQTPAVVTNGQLIEVANHYRAVWPKVFGQPIKFRASPFAKEIAKPATGTNILWVMNDLASAAKPFFVVAQPKTTNKPWPAKTSDEIKFLSKWGMLPDADLRSLNSAKTIDQKKLGTMFGKMLSRVCELTAKIIKKQD
jgi:hypothetical protein